MEYENIISMFFIKKNNPNDWLKNFYENLSIHDIRETRRRTNTV